MNEKEERAYIQGQRAMAQRLLALAISELGDGPELKIAELIQERAEAISILRDACEHHGDNDWPDGLNLADIIDKHLVRHL